MKKGIAFPTLAAIILLVISFIVIFSINTGFAGVLTDSSEKSACSISLVAMHQAKKIDQAEKVRLNCPIQQMNLTLRQLQEDEKNIKKYIDNYKGESFFYKESYLEHAMNKVIAKEMMSAWRTAGEGRLDLFENYWWGDGDLSSEKYKVWAIKGERPVNCIVFARVRFDEGIRNEFKDRKIRSLNEWLKKNQLPKSDTTYMGYLSDDGERSLFEPFYEYGVEESLAVVYARINLYKGEEFAAKYWKKALAGIGVATATVILAPASVPIWAAVLGGAAASGAAAYSTDTVKFDQYNPPPKSKSFIALIPYSRVNDVCIIENIK